MQSGPNKIAECPKSTPTESTNISTPTCEATSKAADAILRWFVEGHDEATIAEALAQLHPEADAEQALSVVADKLREDGQPDPDVLRGWALRCYRDLYRRCVEIGDFDGARKQLKEIMTLVR